MSKIEGIVYIVGVSLVTIGTGLGEGIAQALVVLGVGLAVLGVFGEWNYE
jgi:hypothetical protein